MNPSQSGRWVVLGITAVAAALIGVAIGLRSPSIVIAVIALMSIPGAWIAWRYPEVPLALFLTAGAFKAALGVPVDLTLALAVVVLATVVIAIGQRGWPDVSGYYWLFPAFVAIVVVGAYFGGTAYGVDKALRLLTFGLVAIVGPPVIVRDAKSLDRFLLVLASVGALMSLTALMTGGFAPSSDRFSALGSNTIALGRAAGIAVGYASLRLIWRKPHALASLIVVVAGSVALIGSGSRGPTLALVIAIGVVVLVRLIATGATVARIVGTGGVVAGAATLAWFLVPELALRRFRLLLESAPGASVTVRAEGIGTAGRLFADNPVLGSGTGGFQTVGGTIRYPHNLGAEVAAENGLVGLLVIGSWLAAAFVRAARWARSRPGLAPDVLLFGVSFGLVNAMVSGDLNDNRFLYAMAALALSNCLFQETAE